MQQNNFKTLRIIFHLSLILLFPIISFSQGYNHYYHTADIDNDGDSDIVQAVVETSSYIESIVWFENTDGIGRSLTKFTVSTDFQRLKWFTTTDFDHDGDIDIIAVDQNVDESIYYIVWFENENAVFQDKSIITDEGVGIEWLDIGDLDQDGDIDIVCAEYSLASDVNQICWYEQLNGGEFSSKNVILSYITSYAYHPTQIHVTDVNGDSYPDIVAPCNSYNQFPWLMNISGNGTFTDFWIELEVDFSDADVIDLMPTDLDDDGDIDFLLALYSSVKWLENQNGLGAFGSEKTIADDIYLLRSIFAADLDGDSDLDIMSSAKVSPTNSFNEKAWFENINNATTFGPKRSIDKNPHIIVWAADIEGDGDFDYVSSSSREITWRLNLDGGGTFGDPITTDIENEEWQIPKVYELYQNYPNPFNPSTKIEFSIPLNVKQKTQDVKLVVYDILGREVKTLINKPMLPGKHEVNFNGNDLTSGVYFYVLQTGGKRISRKMLLIK